MYTLSNISLSDEIFVNQEIICHLCLIKSCCQQTFSSMFKFFFSLNSENLVRNSVSQMGKNPGRTKVLLKGMFVIKFLKKCFDVYFTKKIKKLFKHKNTFLRMFLKLLLPLIVYVIYIRKEPEKKRPYQWCFSANCSKFLKIGFIDMMLQVTDP